MVIEKASPKNPETLTIYDLKSITKRLSADDDIEIVEYSRRPFSEDVRGLLGVHESLTVRIRERGTEKLLSFFAKSAKPSFNSFQRALYDAEARFFVHVVPRLLESCRTEQWTAGCHLAKEDLLVLEDLRAVGCRMSAAQLTDDQLRSAVSTVARFHAASFLLEARLGRQLDELYPGLLREKCFAKADLLNWKFLRCSMKLGEDLARGMSLEGEFVSKGYELLMERCESTGGRPRVISHCDLWKNNLLFKEEEGAIKCLLVDFQTVAYRVYTSDLIQLLYINSTREQREKVERECIEVYHRVMCEILQRNGYEGRMVTSDEIIRDYEENRIFGLVYAAHLKPVFLLNKEAMKEYTKDEELFDKYSFVDRTDFVSKVMQEDSAYRLMVEEAVVSLIEYMKSYQKNIVVN